MRRQSRRIALQTPRTSAALWPAAAFLWGFAEATFFFVVPDVLLTALAQRRGFRAAASAAAFAVLGAGLGGLLMWRLGGDRPEAMRAFLDAIPAVSPAMIEAAGPALARDPFQSLLNGAFSGVPYKVFAGEARAAGVSAPLFLAVTIPARAARFVLAAAIAALADRLLARRLGRATRSLVLAGVWVAFYVVYWSLMPA